MSRAMLEPIRVKGRAVIKGIAEGEALVSPIPLMGWRNLDPERGYTTERNHPLFKVPFKGKILVFPEPRGSGGFMYYGSTAKYGLNPAAFVFRKGCALTVFASMLAGVPSMTDFERDPMELIETGDRVVVNADEGYIEIYKKEP